MQKQKSLTRRDFIKITAVAGSALLGGKILPGLFHDGTVIVEETRILMGTIINLAVVSTNMSAGKNAIINTFAEMERQIAIFDQRNVESPIAKLNQKGMLENPPAELVNVLQQAQILSEMTNGAFDVTIKPLIDLYQQAQPSLPERVHVQETLKLVGYEFLEISKTQINFSKPGMSITLDGIAKGQVVDAGVDQLMQLGFDNVYVEAGGDLVVSGVKATESPWRVGVNSPREEIAGTLTILNVTDQAVATSGDYFNYFSSDFLHHHIINPKSGFSSPYIASATVTAPTCTQADGLATALMVLEPDFGLDLIESIAGIECLLVSKDLKEYYSRGFFH